MARSLINFIHWISAASVELVISCLIANKRNCSLEFKYVTAVYLRFCAAGLFVSIFLSFKAGIVNAISSLK